MKRIGFIALAVAMMAVMLLSGCASSEDRADTVEYYSEAEYGQAPAYDDEGSNKAEETLDGESGGAGDTIDYDNSVLQPGVNRKIVYYGTVSAQTTNYEEDYNAILAKVEALGGYVQNVSSSGTKPEDWQDSGRYAEMTLRVPSEYFSEFMNYLGSLGETLSTSMRGDDISLQYYNTTQQLETLRTREERLQELLTQAATMEDIIELEEALSRVSDEIQSLETDLRTYDSLIDFSTVNIYLQEVNVIDKVTPSEKTLGERISSGFYSVLNFLADFGEGLLVFLIAGSPILIPLGLITWLVIWLVRRAKRRRVQKAAEYMNNPGRPTPYYDPKTGRPYYDPTTIPNVGPKEEGPNGDAKEDDKK